MRLRSGPAIFNPSGLRMPVASMSILPRTGMVGIAAFQVTGDHLGDEQGTANITGTRDWLSNVSETDYCHANSTKPTDRCIRG